MSGATGAPAAATPPPPFARPDLLAGRTALVTGGFSGLGQHFALTLARHGARVAIAGRRIALGHQVADDLNRQLGRAGAVSAHALDVRQPASVQALFDTLAAEVGVATIVVNNAGTAGRAAALEVAEQDWMDVVDVNLNGVFRIAQAAGRAMVAAGQGGSLVNIASILGLRVRANVLSYTATKAAVVQMTHALALEWAPHGIRVNALAPGYFETDINRDLLRSPAGQELIGRVPMRRVGSMPELEGPLLLLASDASSFMTGAVLPVDGGHLVNSL